LHSKPKIRTAYARIGSKKPKGARYRFGDDSFREQAFVHGFPRKKAAKPARALDIQHPYGT
jgi:hypothetical protein